MPLYKMTIQAAIERQATLDIDDMAGRPIVEIGFFECFGNSADAMDISFYFFHGQAYAAMTYTLVYLKLIRKGGFDPECFIGAIDDNFFNRSG